MTLVSQIISDAYRETNLIPMGASPSANQTTEALNRLNSLFMLSMGTDVGDELIDLNYGGEYDHSSLINQWIPDNTRLVLNLSAPLTIDLDPEPYEGQRVAILDAGNTIDTHNVILNGNGRKIESTTSVTLSTEGLSRHWMYRGDTGNWSRVSVLAAGDEMPFPIEFDDYWTIMLAGRLNPRYGQAITNETMMTLQRTRAMLRARYRRTTWDIQTDPGLVKRDYGWDSNSFNTGRNWPWY